MKLALGAASAFGLESLSVPSNRAYEVKLAPPRSDPAKVRLSVPSNRAYEVKLLSGETTDIFAATFSTLESGLRSETHAIATVLLLGPAAFSTLESGLRSETDGAGAGCKPARVFQYPRIGPTK